MPSQYVTFTDKLADITIFRGDQVNLGLTIVSGVTGAMADLTGVSGADPLTTLYFTVKEELSNTAAQATIKKQTPDLSGISVKKNEAISGLATVNLTTGDTYPLMSGPYFYGVQLRTGSYVETIATGLFTVKADVTRRTWI